MYYIYKMSHPVSGDVCYVGITDNLYKRFREHIRITSQSEAIVDRRESWIIKLREDNLIPSISVIEIVENKATALEREQYWIDHYIRYGARLCNTQGMRQVVYEPRESKEEKVVKIPVDSLAWRLQYARECKLMTQTDLSGLSGVDINTIGDLEKGRRLPRRKTLEKLVDHLGVSIDYLVGSRQITA